MLRRYRKIKEDMPLLSGEDRGRYFGKRVFCIKTNVIYLLLSSSTSFYLHVVKTTSLYLQGKRNLRKIYKYSEQRVKE